ncbi:MAG: hypothetical protein ACI8TQ_002067 [Planctomycetota bacterium]|jgi:hypothetical protein
MHGQDDSQAEIKELFAKVEKSLLLIDRFLSDAAAGDVPIGLPEESGLADLLRETQAASQSAINDIDQILQIASQQSQQSSQGSSESESPPPPGESPLDKPSDGAPQEQEPTPEMPQPGKPEDSQQSEGSKPEDVGQDELKENENKEGEAGQPNTPVNPNAPDDDGQRWGELPPRVREVFRSQGGGDLPTQYRDWIDSYYRRLNKR